MERTEKRCPQCDTVKPIESFLPRRRRGRVVRSCWCRECKNRIDSENYYAKTDRERGQKIRPGPKPKRVVVSEKKCSRCEVVKPASEFHRHNLTRDGLNARCKACVIDRAASWMRENPEKVSARAFANRLSRYGITREQFDALWVRSGGSCELCREKPVLGIDHDHETGIVRGLLCYGCNQRMATFDDKAFLKRAAIYVLQARRLGVGCHVDVKRRRL